MKAGIQPKVEVAASPQVSDSFVVLHAPDGKLRIGIKRAALEKEFLLQTELIKQPVAPLANGLQSRVVAFRQRDGRLFLMEATQGHTVTNEFPQNLLLAAYDILDERDGVIFFDFNKGMSRLFLADDMHASDTEGSDFTPIETTAGVALSYLDDVKLNASNTLQISQVAQLEVASQKGLLAPMVEARYYLRPYQPDPGFEPTLSPGFDRYGFFEVAPQLGLDGKTVVRAAKLDLRKPIVFAVSSNTPSDYRQAVKDGVLYWNRFLPGSPIQVVDAPEGVRAPDPNYNMVQWVKWDQAGSAYADTQTDPRSGQVMHAQVYIPSVFAYPRKAVAKSLIERIRLDSPTPRAGLKGFMPEALCALGSERMLESMGQMISRTKAPGKALKASQDMVRYVVAHEIGHTLGMRHNFAGSLGASEDFALVKRTDLLKAYLETDHTPEGIVPSSSVMDYLIFEEAVMTGDLIAKGSTAMAYDKTAVAFLYGGQKFQKKDVPVFCTDSNVGKFVDCRPFDTGHSAVEFASWQAPQAITDFPYDVLGYYDELKVGTHGDQADKLSHLSFIPDNIAKRFFGARADLVKSFTDPKMKTHFVLAHHLFPFFGPLDEEEILGAEYGVLETELTRLGGPGKVFTAVTSADFLAMERAMGTVLTNRQSNPDPGEASFTSDELRVVNGMAALLFRKLPSSFAKADMEMIGKLPLEWRAPGTRLGEGFLQLILNRAKEYLFATREGAEVSATLEFPQVTPATAPVKVDVKLPGFFYPPEVRLQTVALLNSGGPVLERWAGEARKAVRSDLLKLVQGVLKDYPIEKLKDFKVTPAEKTPLVQMWFLQNGMLARQLAAAPSGDLASMLRVLGGDAHDPHGSAPGGDPGDDDENLRALREP